MAHDVEYHRISSVDTPRDGDALSDPLGSIFDMKKGLPCLHERDLMKAHVQLLVSAICGAALLYAGASVADTPVSGVVPRMKAVVHHDYGSPEVLRLEEVEKPVPHDDQVLIRVRAASANPLDWHFLRGAPYIARLQMGLLEPKATRLGVDVAGQVEAVGRNVTKFQPGDEVFGNRFGAFAEYVCAPETSLVLKPANVTFEEAAAVPVAAITALQGLRDKGKLQPGQKVLINGASGGVGTFAVQIAKLLGADVTGVCSTRNVELVRSLGADHVIDYTKEDFTKSGQQYDVILDMIGNHSLSDCGRALTAKGTLVLTGNTDKGRWLGPVSGMLRGVVLSRFVSHDIVAFVASVNQEDLTVLRDLMQAGQMKAVIDRRYKLSEVPAAIQYVEEGHARGKVVITLDHDDETAPVSVNPAASSVDRMGPLLTVLAFVGAAMGVPVIGALALQRRFMRRHPGKRPYRWGYYFSLQSFIAGVGLGVMLESGVVVVIVCAGIYAALAWFFAQRHRWAWIALTFFSFNPVVWIANFTYLRKRWAEDTHVARSA
jgi:NADPH:quinone reductase-like Zn-dependent oxidoreductase